jgi:1-acyl-sn-glycerol-3-phosphate acyltransferase
MGLTKYILKKKGWTVSEEHTRTYSKYVMIIAPHTSAWDFIWGKMCFASLHLPVRFLIKKGMFFFPVGPIIKKLGAIPINPHKNNRVLDQIKQLFDSNEQMIIAITPEGTRKQNTNWKRGFYHIAKKVNVPIAITTLDYKKKEAKVQKIVHPSEISLRELMFELQNIYKDVNAKFPKDFALLNIKKS